MSTFKYKYKVDKDNGVVVAFSTFAKQKVAGIARCAPSDTFDIEVGKRLAAARCDVKIAKLRQKRALLCLDTAREESAFWNEREKKMQDYLSDAIKAYDAASGRLSALKDTL